MSARADYIPKFITCLKEGISKQTLLTDLFAGVTLGIIALPLSMALAIGSGLSPERGLFTAIVAGFLISLFSGSRIQIGGPTGAFVVIVYDIVQRQGYEGLVIATLLAGIGLLIMGLCRFGALLKFIPSSLIMGLTAGIALVLFSSQVKDFFGLQLDAVPADFLTKWGLYFSAFHTISPYALGISLGTILLIGSLKRFLPKIPGVIIAVILAALIVYFFNLPVETIQSRFGQIPRTLPAPAFPLFSLEQIRSLMPDAITIAILAGLESLLCAVVGDGMTGFRHRPNCELVAQGIGNIGSVIFGGIPATGAIARTATNVRLGGRTPISGMVHALTVLFVLFFFSSLAEKIPLAALAGVLAVIAWNMAELPHVFESFKGPWTDTALLIATFILTVLIDITVAVEIGVLLAAVLFVKRMADSTTLMRKEEADAPFKEKLPEDVEHLQLNGPLFFGAVDLLNQGISQAPTKYRVVILEMVHVPFIDMSGIRALFAFAHQCRSAKVKLYICGLNANVQKTLHKTGFVREIGEKHLFSTLNEAVVASK